MDKSFKRRFSVVLIASLALSCMSIGVNAETLSSTDNIVLNADVLIDENSINLNWNVENPTQPFDFKIMKKRNDELNYSALGVGTNKDKVTVLNIYPTIRGGAQIPLDTSYVTWDGENIEQLPQSARLKRWIEEANDEDNKGYGKGMIEVIPVSIDDFNNCTEEYLFKSGSSYYTKYKGGTFEVDAVMLGSWDAPSSYNASSKAVLAVKSYIDDRGSFIFGHDSLHKETIFESFFTYLNIENQDPTYVDGSQVVVGGSHMESIKKGALLEHPWDISEDELNIPMTHTSWQMVNKSDVWVEFSRPDDGVVPGSYGELLVEYGGKTNNHYLTINNNIAFIQTGHSEGKATIDEQKIIANVLFYMTQVSNTEGTSFEDAMGVDVSSPVKPNVSSLDIDMNKQKIRFKGVESNDMGTEYSYYVEGTGRNDGAIVDSNIATVNTMSGLKGYSYILDGNPNGVPDNEVDIKSISSVIEHSFLPGEIKQYYLHIKAIDNAGNFSETTHIRLSSLDHEVAINNVDIAESSSTSINLKLARDAVNNLPESFIKEELQDRLNAIYDITDIVFDKYNATANLDIYIKSENILSLSLNSNSISFEDFNGTEDLEQIGAVDVTVNSSLPYEINAYLEEEIQNADKTEVMDKSILNLKESSDTDYKEFVDIKTKLNLVTHSDAGNDKVHNFDFKLNGGISHKKDVYKTTIKFEVKQK